MVKTAKSKPPVVMLVGAGSMGGAMLRSWIEANVIAKNSIIVDPALTPEMKAFSGDFGLSVYGHSNDIPPGSEADILIYAVKPQIAGDVLPDFEQFAKNSVNVSIMAGKSIDAIKELLGGPEKIVRVMPNLPASIGEGMSGAYATDAVSLSDRASIEILLKASGKNIWVKNEEGIDFVTAISGSGPAYFFLLTEAITEAGIDLGLEPNVAQTLARQTAIGAGALMVQDERSAAELRRAITSPGGTTDAALKVLDEGGAGLRLLILEAARMAAKRAKELSE